MACFVGSCVGVRSQWTGKRLCEGPGVRNRTHRRAQVRAEIKMPGVGGVAIVGDDVDINVDQLKAKASSMKGATVVVKYGGAAMSSEDLKKKVINDVAIMQSLGIKVVLVHGGGPEVNLMLKRLGIEAVFRNGLRVTDQQTMEVVEMVLAGKVNKSLVSLVNQNGARAVGLCGKDGNMVMAKQKSADLGLVGEVTQIDDTLLHSLLDSSFVPVVSSIASGEDGTAYNINADTLAGRIAEELKVTKLVMMTDVPGVMRDPKDISSLYSSLTTSDVQELIDEGVISGGMIPKVECCTDALSAGVKQAHIVDGRRPHALLLELFGDGGIGTMIS